MHVLIVEDEPGLRTGLEDLVIGAGHTAVAVGDGEEAVAAGLDERVNLVLLDIMLPKLNGVAVCRELRRRRPELFILLLTARGAERDKIRGLGAGADDYVTKPFGAQELLARIGAFERRSRTMQPETLEVDGCRLDLGRCEAIREGETATLTAREVAILRLLHAHRKRAVSRAELLESVWQAPGDLTTRTVDVTIANLRQKIERDSADPQVIVTVKGVGYAWGER